MKVDFKNKKTRLIIITGGVVLLLSLSIGLGVGLSNSSTSNNSNTPNNNVPDQIGMNTTKDENEQLIEYVDLLNSKTNDVLSNLDDNTQISDIETVKNSLKETNGIAQVTHDAFIDDIRTSSLDTITKAEEYISHRNVIEPIRETISNLKTEVAFVSGNDFANFTDTIRGEYDNIDLTTIPDSFKTNSKTTNDLIKDYYDYGYQLTTLELRNLTRYFNTYMTDLDTLFGRTIDAPAIRIIRLNLSHLRNADKDSFFRSKSTIDLYQTTQEKLYDGEIKLAEHLNTEYKKDTTSTTATSNLIGELNRVNALLTAEKDIATESYYLTLLDTLADTLTDGIDPVGATEPNGNTDFNVAVRELRATQQGVSTTIVTRANAEVKATTTDLKNQLDVTFTRQFRSNLIETSTFVETLKLDLERTIPLIGGNAEEQATKTAAQTEINRADAWITKLYQDWGTDSLDTLASVATNEGQTTEDYYGEFYKVKNYTRYVDFSSEQTSTSGTTYHTFTTGSDGGGLTNWYPNKLKIIALQKQISNIEDVKNTFSIERINDVITEAETLLTNTPDTRINNDTQTILETKLAELKIRRKEVSLKLNIFKLNQYIKSKNTTKITETVNELQRIISTVVPTDNLTNVIAEATTAIGTANTQSS